MMAPGTETPSAHPTVRILLWLGAVLSAVVAVQAFRESWGGIKPVAVTVNAVAVAMLFLLGMAMVASLAFRKRRWRVLVVAPLTALIVILAGFGTYAVYQGHTAAHRVADDVAKFATPAGFTVDATATADAKPDTNRTQFVSRIWRADGSAANPCDAVTTAVKNWDGGPVRPNVDHGRCAFESRDGDRNIHLELKGDVLTLQMWLQKSSALTF